jgi:hypothetical protein
MTYLHSADAGQQLREDGERTSSETTVTEEGSQTERNIRDDD